MKRLMIVGAFAFSSFAASQVAAQESVEALTKSFCDLAVAGDAVKLGNLYTEDTVYYGVDGANHTGREAVTADWAGFLGAFDVSSCEMNLDGRAAEKNSAVSWGLWTIIATPTAGGDPVTMSGRFMDYAVKTKDGWKYRVDHASMAKPAE